MTIGLRERNRQVAMDTVRSAAYDLMSAHGFQAVTVEQIAARAGVSPSTVYRYFGTKEALVLSADRPAQLAERLSTDDSTRLPLEAFTRAAVKIWVTDNDAPIELGLVIANPPLLEAWERQLLDQRAAVSNVLALRRGAEAPGSKDQALSAAALAVLMTFLVRWHVEGGSKKRLEKLLTKAFAALA